MKKIFVCMVVAFGAIGSIACTTDTDVARENDPAPTQAAKDSVPVRLEGKHDAPGNVAAQDFWCWRIWWGCASDKQTLTDCNWSGFDGPTFCNSCGYTCSGSAE
jgi:hypothetical protein